MSGYIGTQPVPQATQKRQAFIATNGQTSFATSGYSVGFVDVYMNGVKLAAADYTATNGSDVVLSSGALVNDIVEIVAFTSFVTSGSLPATGGTVTGDITFNDSIKSKFGTGADLQVFHNGTDAKINNDTGHLDLSNTTAGSSIRILGSGESLAEFSDDGDVDLFFNGALKLSTTNTGVTVAGVLAATTLTGNGAGITGLSAGGEATFTATGAISAGNPVGFNANGTISAMPKTSGSAAALGSGASSTGGGRQPMAYDTAADKYLHVFSGTSDKLFARVGTISNLGITFGTAVDSGTTLSDLARTRGELHLVYDDNAGKFVVSYDRSDNKGCARTITISGTTPSFGTEVLVFNGTTYHTEVGYDSNANKVVFINAGNQATARARVGTISGTNITLGSEANLGGSAMYPVPGSLTFDSNVNKFIFVYGTSNAARPYNARTISISGTSVSAGSEVSIADSGEVNKVPFVVFDPSINKAVALFDENGPKFRLLTISGTSLTRGTTTALTLTTTPVSGINGEMFSSCVDPDTAGIVICYSTGSGETRITPAKFSGVNMTLGDEVVVSLTKKQNGIIYDPDADATIVSTLDQAHVVKPITRPAYVGVASESISNGATGKVTIIGGVNANQSSLSAGSQYGIPSTSASLVATDVNPIGIAISSTEIYIRAVSI
tara:strand:+ start:1005 stop:3005 length:2001 start_codon:yes stop_codon:yes gene_type:complete